MTPPGQLRWALFDGGKRIHRKKLPGRYPKLFLFDGAEHMILHAYKEVLARQMFAGSGDWQSTRWELVPDASLALGWPYSSSSPVAYNVLAWADGEGRVRIVNLNPTQIPGFGDQPMMPLLEIEGGIAKRVLAVPPPEGFDAPVMSDTSNSPLPLALYVDPDQGDYVTGRLMCDDAECVWEILENIRLPALPEDAYRSGLGHTANGTPILVYDRAVEGRVRLNVVWPGGSLSVPGQALYWGFAARPDEGFAIAALDAPGKTLWLHIFDAQFDRYSSGFALTKHVGDMAMTICSDPTGREMVHMVSIRGERIYGLDFDVAASFIYPWDYKP